MTENKKKYTYDYPENRELGLKLNKDDKKLIVKLTGFGYAYVSRVITGSRTNRDIIRIAKSLIQFNEKVAKMRERFLNKTI